MTDNNLSSQDTCHAWETIRLLTESPIMNTVSFLLYRNKLKNHVVESVEIINKSKTDYFNADDTPTQYLLLAARFNHFIKTKPRRSVFLQLDVTKVINIPTFDPQKWNLHLNKDIEGRSNLTQPIIKDGRYFSDQYEHDTDGLHKCEAKNIFLDTQYKRLLRVFSKDEKWQYFLKEDRENEDTIYDQQTPLAYSVEPISHYIGHATQLIQWHQLNILIDPVFGDLNPILYPRKTKPGVKIEHLPVIDVILICHNHHDHCHLPSLKKLVCHQPIVIVPKGDGKLMRNLGFKHVQEQEWWQKAVIKSARTPGLNFEFYSTPTWHWSGRGLFDSNRSLCLGWVIKSSQEDRAIYYAGDTARMPDRIYKEIHDHLPTPFVNFEPGGPNQKREDMETTHQSLADSLESHFRLTLNEDHTSFSKQTQELKTVIIHHNTFELGTDCFNDSLRIWKGIIRAIKEGLTEPENEHTRISWDVIQSLRCLPFSKEVILDVLEKQVFFPKIGSITKLDD